MTRQTVGTRDEWLVARRALLDAEKDLTRRSDELARQRQQLPWVRLEKDYRFDTEEGEASLRDRRELARLCNQQHSTNNGGGAT